MKAAQNIDGIQKVNRCTVLKLMLENDKISRAEIARRTGLNKATITNIINEFSEMNIVVSCGQILDSNGRKTAGLSLNLDIVVVLAVRINRGFINFGVCSMMGEITNRSKKSFCMEEKIENILDLIRNGIQEMITVCSNRKILSISIAIIGPLMNRIAKVYDMPELAKVDIQEEVTKMYPRIKVFLDHDANMSSFAEWRNYKMETGRTKGVMLTLDFGAGIDGGIMIDGKLFRGGLGIAGDVGQMGINFNMGVQVPLTYKGIFENYASPVVMKREAIARLFEFPNSQITGGSSLEEIYSLYEKGDDLAVWALDRMSWFLAYGLSSFIYILNPDIIVLGDQIIRSETFMNKLKKNMRDFLPEEIMDALDIHFSNFKDGGMLLGASIMAVDSYIESLEIIDFLKENFAANSKTPK